MNFTVFISFLSLFTNKTSTTNITTNNTSIESDKCRYSDPYQGMCRTDEINVEIKYKDIYPKLCTTKCKFNSDCQQDTCPYIISKPKCILEDDFGEKYCGFNCDENNMCSNDEYMVCMETPKNKGFCAYLR